MVRISEIIINLEKNPQCTRFCHNTVTLNNRKLCHYIMNRQSYCIWVFSKIHLNIKFKRKINYNLSVNKLTFFAIELFVTERLFQISVIFGNHAHQKPKTKKKHASKHSSINSYKKCSANIRFVSGCRISMYKSNTIEL